MKRLDYVLIFVYVAIMATATVGMFVARRNTLGGDQKLMIKQYGSWVEEAERQSQPGGPVKRRRPVGNEPPRIILLRDYFGVCLAAIWVLGSGTIGTLLLLLRGVLTSGSPSAHAGEAELRG